jgi:hypothetical protein
MYLDNEVPEEQVSGIQLHLEKCETCKKLLDDAQADSSEVNDFLSKLNEGESLISTPPFDPNINRIRFRKRNPVSLLWKVAAGIALLFGLFWIIQSRPSSQEISLDQAEILLLELMGDVEPNKAWHNGQMGIIILDEDGDVLQSFISNDTE